MTIDDIASNLRALQLGERSSSLEELRATLALVALFELPAAKTALGNERSRVKENIRQQCAMARRPPSPPPTRLRLGKYELLLLGLRPGTVLKVQQGDPHHTTDRLIVEELTGIRGCVVFP